MKLECRSVRHFAVGLALVLTGLIIVTDAACEDDLGVGKEPVQLILQENTPKDTVLMKITDDNTLFVDTTTAPFLKVENGSLLTAVNISVDDNEELCRSFSEGIIVTELSCEKTNGRASRYFVVDLNVTDDHPTEWVLQHISIREQAKDLQVVDWSTPDKLKSVIGDTDCLTTIELTVDEDNKTMEYFDIQPGPIIYIKKSLDYEANKQHTINITAFVALSNSNRQEYHGQLVINVEDVDDRDPFFQSQVYHLYLPETNDTDVKTAMGREIIALDGDTRINATMHYSIVSSDPPLKASITDEGKLLVTGPFERENAPTYKIIVKATQEDNPMASATATVSLSITDINDNRPQFSEAQEVNVTIEENASAGTHVTWLQATDADEGENAKFRYSIQDDTGAFEIITDPVVNLAELIVKDSDLLAGQKSVVVSIRLIEQTEAEGGDVCDFVNSCSVNISVTIVDVNDNTPSFTQSRYSLNIYDDQDIDVEFGKIEATDPDRGKNAQVRYQLSSLTSTGSPDCVKVLVGVETGVLTLRQNMMAGVTCYYSATACDSPIEPQDKRCANALVTVSVTESPSSNSTSDVLMYDIHIQEGVGIGTRVMELPMTGLVALNTNFTIDGRVLKTAVELDQEKQNIQVVIAGRQIGSQFVEVLRVTVYVDNINDNSPTFDKDHYEIQLKESDRAGHVVLNVSATDADSPDENVTYALLNMKNIFDIDRVTGQISLVVTAIEAAETDEGTAPSQGYGVLFVEARDAGVPPFKATAKVQVYFSSMNNTANVMVPVRKDTLVQDKTSVERKLTELLGIPVQVLSIESIGSVQGLGSKILLKQDSQGGQSNSNQDLKRLIEQNEKAIHDAFAQKYNVKDNGHPDNDGDEDDDGLSVLAIILICLVAVLFIAIIIIALMCYHMRKRYKSELSLLHKLNKSTSIYDRAPLVQEASSTTNGSVQGTNLHQNGSPRRESINLVAYTNDAYIGDGDDNDPTYSRIQETQGNGAHHPRSNGQSTTYANNREVTSSSQRAEHLTEPSANPVSLHSDIDGEEEPVYSRPRPSGNNNVNTNPVFRTTIDVVYPGLKANSGTQHRNESSTDSTPSSQTPYPTALLENDGRSGPNWSFRRNSKLDIQQQSPGNTSIDPHENGDFDDIDSNLVSPASSRQRRGSMKAGSESDSGLPSDRDLRLDDEGDLDTKIALQHGPGKGNSPIYPNIYSVSHPDNVRTNLASTQPHGNGSPTAVNADFTLPYEPEPDYNKRVRFEEAKRRGEMVELPRQESVDIAATDINQDTEVTSL